MESQPQTPNLQNQPNSPTVATPPIYPEATQPGVGISQPLNQPVAISPTNLNTNTKKPHKYILYILIPILVIGLVAGTYMALQPKSHKVQPVVIKPTYASHLLNVGGQKISLSFDKNATLSTPNANQAELKGADLAGNNINIILKTVTPTATTGSCGGLKGTTSALLGSVTILNKSYPLCGIPSASASAQYFGYIGVRFQSDNKWYEGEFSLPQGVNYLVDKNTVKQVLESIATQ